MQGCSTSSDRTTVTIYSRAASSSSHIELKPTSNLGIFWDPLQISFFSFPMTIRLVKNRASISIGFSIPRMTVFESTPLGEGFSSNISKGLNSRTCSTTLLIASQTVYANSTVVYTFSEVLLDMLISYDREND